MLPNGEGGARRSSNIWSELQVSVCEWGFRVAEEMPLSLRCLSFQDLGAVSKRPICQMEVK